MNAHIQPNKLYRRLRRSADFSSLRTYLHEFQNGLESDPDDLLNRISNCPEGFPELGGSEWDELAIFTWGATSYLESPTCETIPEEINCWGVVSCAVLPGVVTCYAHEPGRMLLILYHALRNHPVEAVDEFEAYTTWLIRNNTRDEGDPMIMQIVIEILLAFLREDESLMRLALEHVESLRADWGSQNLSDMLDGAGVNPKWWKPAQRMVSSEIMTQPAFKKWHNLITNCRWVE